MNVNVSATRAANISIIITIAAVMTIVVTTIAVITTVMTTMAAAAMNIIHADHKDLVAHSQEDKLILRKTEYTKTSKGVGMKTDTLTGFCLIRNY